MFSSRNPNILRTFSKVIFSVESFFIILTKGGMIESRQDMIEITDCDFLIFQGLYSL